MNATIDLYSYCTIEPTSDGKIVFSALDRKEIVEMLAIDDVKTSEVLALHKGVYRRIVREFCDGRPLSMTMATYSDAAAGSGLGTSSTLVVCMVQAYNEWLKLGLGEYDIAHLAYEIERCELGLSGGKQDQYAAAFGGFNFMEFYADDRVIVNPLRIKESIISELECSLVLFHTGQSRESATIIDEQIKNARANNTGSLEAMQQLKREAVAMKEFLLRGELADFGRILGNSWHTKKQISKVISNPTIERIYHAVISSGGTAGKVSGAGGGGVMMFVVEPLKRCKVIETLHEFPGEVLNCHFSRNGAEAWTV